MTQQEIQKNAERRNREVRKMTKESKRESYSFRVSSDTLISWSEIEDNLNRCCDVAIVRTSNGGYSLLVADHVLHKAHYVHTDLYDELHASLRDIPIGDIGKLDSKKLSRATQAVKAVMAAPVSDPNPVEVTVELIKF